MGDGAKAAWAAEQTAGWTTAWMTKRMEKRTNRTLDGGAV